MTQQIFQAVEAIKLAYLSHTPVVWLVTGDKEVASEVAEEFVKEHYGSFRSSKPPVTVNLETFEGHIKDRTKPTISYKWLGNDDEQSLKALNEAIEDFVTYYLHLQAGEVGVQGMEDHHIDGIKKSLVIIASPSLPEESWLNKYIEFVYVNPLTDDEIRTVILETFSDKGIYVEEKSRIDQLKVSLRGFSVRQISQTINRCIVAGFFDFKITDWKRVFKEVRKMKRQMLEGFKGLKWIEVEEDEPKRKSMAKEKNSSLDVISGWLDDRWHIFDDTEAAERKGYDIPKGILITGIPGTGKSMMAKVSAQKLRLPLISLDMGDLQEGLVGASEQHMVDALRVVEAMAPCVLWIDEIEKAFSGSNSGSSDGGVMRRMFGKFLTWMQEKKAPCFVFATSNDISKLPPELFRSERFDDKFFSFMPMVDECAAIFSSLIKKENRKYIKNHPDEDYDYLFSVELTKPDVWKAFLNGYSRKRGLVEMEGHKWMDGKIPQCKLFTGADISMLVKLVKFELLKQFEGRVSNLKKDLVLKTMEDVMDNFMPYGQTNLHDIAKCFVSLSRNRFKSASSSSVIKFDDYNMETSEMRYDANRYADDYDKVLYAAVIGAINFYANKKSE